MAEQRDRDNLPEFEDYEPTAEFQMVLAVAVALRAEFGVTIDAHPGGEDADAGVVNRALRATARVILAGAVFSIGDLAAVESRALQRAARLRLVELGMDGGRAEHLLEMEPGLGDSWLAYLALAPATVIQDLIGRDE